MHKSERQFAEYLKSQDIPYQYEPQIFDLDGTHYTPDFYIPKEDIYYEVIASRSIYNKGKGKYRRVVNMHNIKLKLVNPNGSPYSCDLNDIPDNEEPRYTLQVPLSRLAIELMKYRMKQLGIKSRIEYIKFLISQDLLKK